MEVQTSDGTVIEREETMVEEAAGAPERRSGRLNKIILLAAAAIALNAIFNYSLSDRTSSNKMLKVGDAMPPFSVKLIDGSEITGEDFKGKPTTYFFYADWCPCSHQSIDWVKRAREDSRYAGLSFVGIGIQDSAEKLARFARQYQLDFPVSNVGGDGLARSVGVSVTPTTVFVGPDGVIRSIFVGKIERYNQLTDGLDAITPAAAAGKMSG